MACQCGLDLHYPMTSNEAHTLSLYFPGTLCPLGKRGTFGTAVEALMVTEGGEPGKKVCSPSVSTQDTAEQGPRAQIALLLIGFPEAQQPAPGRFQSVPRP